jgi:hypothetical protein
MPYLHPALTPPERLWAAIVYSLATLLPYLTRRRR